MKSGGKKTSPRAAMSEPHLRTGRAVAGLGDSFSEMRQPQSRTVQKRKSMSGRDLLRWKRQQFKQRAEETITKRLFVDSEEMARSSDGTGSPLLPQRVANKHEHDSSPDGSTPRTEGATGSIHKRRKGKVGAFKAPTPTPKMAATSTPESRDSNMPSGHTGSVNKSKRGKKKTPRTAKKAPNTPTHNIGSSKKPDRQNLDSSLDTTLPMDESTTKTDVGNVSQSDGDDDAVTFPNTPVPGIKPGKSKTTRDLDTPAVTEKTPMPVGDEEWKDEGAPAVGQSKGDWKKSLSRVKRENKKKQFLVKCSNIPKGVTPELFAMFLGECDVYPAIRIKRMKRGGAGWKRPPRYAILVCKTKEDYDNLLNLDGISIPQLTPKGKEMTLNFIPQMTHSEARSSHALRVTNMADDVTENELRAFFKKKRLTCGTIQLYPADRAAYVVFKSAGDMRRARRMKERKLKGCLMELKTNKGYINHDVEHSLMED